MSKLTLCGVLYCLLRIAYNAFRYYLLLAHRNLLDMQRRVQVIRKDMRILKIHQRTLDRLVDKAVKSWDAMEEMDPGRVVVVGWVPRVREPMKRGAWCDAGCTREKHAHPRRARVRVVEEVEGENSDSEKGWSGDEWE